MRTRCAWCTRCPPTLLLRAPEGAVCKIVWGVISPLLANVYLHYVLDVWFEQEVKPRLKGRAFLVRYADDCAPRRRQGRLQERPRSHAA